ncbi:4017_t:CDS:2 [Funneliformis caledonium]|uniref:4017_t:CDS:1 n=1 Tax=Funneliformis caledonium TaxID=1117310 RepID=A0A9N8WB77_9GLOM|nr:4017_t:CDS:2 [Funneliformis caledonium]
MANTLTLNYLVIPSVLPESIIRHSITMFKISSNETIDLLRPMIKERQYNNRQDEREEEMFPYQLISSNFSKQNLKLNNKKHYNILRKQEVMGQDFLDMTEERLLASSYNFPSGLAMRLAKETKILKEKLKRAFFSYKSLSEELAKYSIDSNSTDSIPLFSLQTTKFKTLISTLSTA